MKKKNNGVLTGPFTYLPHRMEFKLRKHNHSMLGYEKLQVEYLILAANGEFAGYVLYDGFGIDTYLAHRSEAGEKYWDMVENYVTDDENDKATETTCFYCSKEFKKAMNEAEATYRTQTSKTKLKKIKG